MNNTFFYYLKNLKFNISNLTVKDAAACNQAVTLSPSRLRQRQMQPVGQRF